MIVLVTRFTYGLQQHVNLVSMRPTDTEMLETLKELTIQRDTIDAATTRRVELLRHAKQLGARRAEIVRASGLSAPTFDRLTKDIARRAKPPKQPKQPKQPVETEHDRVRRHIAALVDQVIAPDARQVWLDHCDAETNLAHLKRHLMSLKDKNGRVKVLQGSIATLIEAMDPSPERDELTDRANQAITVETLDEIHDTLRPPIHRPASPLLKPKPVPATDALRAEERRKRADMLARTATAVVTRAVDLNVGDEVVWGDETRTVTDIHVTETHDADNAGGCDGSGKGCNEKIGDVTLHPEHGVNHNIGLFCGKTHTVYP